MSGKTTAVVVWQVSVAADKEMLALFSVSEKWRAENASYTVHTHYAPLKAEGWVGVPEKLDQSLLVPPRQS